MLRATLERAGYVCPEAESAPAALDWIARNGLPDLAIVDIRMPGMSGVDLSRRVHAFSDLPIILLTAVDDEATMVESIETFAADYVVKPFSPAVLAARVNRLLRRSPSWRPARETRVDGRLSIRFQDQVAVIAGTAVALTTTETKLLYALMRSFPRTLRNSELLARVWTREESFEETLRVHVHRLRQKIEVDPGRPRYLVTERGLGYRFGVLETARGRARTEPVAARDNGREATAAGPVLRVDTSRLRALRALSGDRDDGLVAELVAKFAADAPKRLRALEEAVAAGDGETATELAHALSGLSLNVGANKLARHLRQEASTSRPQWDVALLFDELEATLAELRQAASQLAAGVTP